jgi:hypothetical protein
LMLTYTLLIAFATGLQAAPAAVAPGAIEQALIEQRCSGTRMGTTVSADPYHDCLATQLAVLRSGFGLNLEQLSAVDRRALDKACSRIRSIEGRERYIECLSVRLAALHDSRVAATPVPISPAAASAPGTVNSPEVVIHREADWSFARRLGTAGMGLAAVVVTSGYMWLRFRKHGRAGVCAGCGMAVDGGDFCPACRREAAERLRREAATRSLPST